MTEKTATTFKEIRDKAIVVMESFQEDLETDRLWMDANPDVDFIHVTRKSGTHIIAFPNYEYFIKDEPLPHLFSVLAPSEICRLDKELINGALKQSGLVWMLCQKGRVREITQEQASSKYTEHLARAHRMADRAKEKCA